MFLRASTVALASSGCWSAMVVGAGSARSWGGRVTSWSCLSSWICLSVEVRSLQVKSDRCEWQRMEDGHCDDGKCFDGVFLN